MYWYGKCSNNSGCFKPSQGDPDMMCPKKDGHAGKPVHSKIFGWVQEVSWNWKQLIIYHPWSRNNCLPKLLGWFGWFQFALTWTSHLKLTSHVLFTFEPGSHMTYQGDGGALNPLRHQTKKLLKQRFLTLFHCTTPWMGDVCSPAM
jgi:hypothetical protein